MFIHLTQISQSIVITFPQAMQRIYNWRRGFTLVSCTAFREYLQVNHITETENIAFTVQELWDDNLNRYPFLYKTVCKQENGQTVSTDIILSHNLLTP